jgi:hypothetical protein
MSLARGTINKLLVVGVNSDGPYSCVVITPIWTTIAAVFHASIELFHYQIRLKSIESPGVRS